MVAGTAGSQWPVGAAPDYRLAGSLVLTIIGRERNLPQYCVVHKPDYRVAPVLNPALRREIDD
jgi:hypothetical protein